jgi:chromosome segregation ATPase
LFEPKQQAEAINSSFNFQNMASKILPKTGPIFTAAEQRTISLKEGLMQTAELEGFGGMNFYSRTGDQLMALESRLENETLRRQHCEKQIHELNEHLLELQQQLAIANSLDKKRDMFVQSMDASLQKILDNWKQREAKADKSLDKLRIERDELLAREQKHLMRLQFLESELKVSTENLISEKVKTQELQNEVAMLKSALNDALESYIDRKNEVCNKTVGLTELSLE